MKKLTLVLALCVLAMAANALTVYYKNVTSWTKVCAYTFSEETLGKWPGAEMTAVAGHDGWYSIEVDETKSANIIFNNGGNGDQTGDLTIDAAQPYYNEAWTTGFDDEAVVDIYTVYYKNTAHWASVYAYAWGGAANTGSWPGKPMTAVADHADWYSIDFKGGLPANIIFNGGNGAPQTKDLTIDAGNLYYNNGWTDGFDGDVVVVIPEVCFMKHPFDGVTWEWKQMTKNEDNTFSLDAYWYGVGVNVSTVMDDAAASWFPAEQINNCPAETGIKVVYTYDAAADAVSITVDETPVVALVAPERVTVGEEVTFGVTVLNVKNPSIVYSVQAPGASEFATLEGTTYTPAVAGIYTVKVSVASEGYAGVLEDTKEMTAVTSSELNGDYYLVGYINGADYGIEADKDNVGEYKFVDGKLTATFTGDSYVLVKTGDNKNWYMSKGYAAAPPAVLYTTDNGGDNKLFVPGNVEVVFTLTANSDGTLTLSYVVGETPIPVEPDYYLVGYINGADYGCEADYENLGEYKFVDGKLTATFTETSYVYVKTGDNKNWYMSAAYVAPATTATAVLAIAGETVAEKVGVPASAPVDFTLTENGDGTLTLSYVANQVITAVENVTEKYVMTLDNGLLSVMTDNPVAVALYTVNGQLLDIQQTTDYRCRLGAGVYLVRIGNTVEKVAVF